MKVNLVSITQSILPDRSPEDLIVFCARASNPKNQENFKTSGKLLKYCMDEPHWSVFEMADMTVEIETSRAISLQVIRHKSFSFQQFSQRYAKQVGFEPLEWRRQDKKNRQNSIDDFSIQDIEDFNFLAAKAIETCNGVYNKLLERDVAKECARFVLPECATTKLYMKGSIRSWIHYLQVRLDKTTQKEHRDIAEEVLNIFNKEFPTIASLIQ